jgi:hypothetical protein
VFTFWKRVLDRVILVNVWRALLSQAAAQEPTMLCVRQGKPRVVSFFDVRLTHRCSPCQSTRFQPDTGTNPFPDLPTMYRETATGFKARTRGPVMKGECGIGTALAPSMSLVDQFFGRYNTGLGISRSGMTSGLPEPDFGLTDELPGS